MWFYDIEADGWSLDDKRTPSLDEGKLGPVVAAPLTTEEHAKNNLPDARARWESREGTERLRPRTAQSFCVPKADMAANGYDLSLNRYKEVVHDPAPRLRCTGETDPEYLAAFLNSAYAKRMLRSLRPD